MPPGVRISKRVRAGAPTEMPPGVSTRSAKRQLIAEQGKGNAMKNCLQKQKTVVMKMWAVDICFKIMM